MTKAARLFLILVDIGIPDRIFALVDESYDDSDLPISEANVDLLRLSPDKQDDPGLDERFFHAQWRFLVRGISRGEHVRFSQNEGVPVEMLRGRIINNNDDGDDGVEKVILAGAVCRVYLRTRVKVRTEPDFFEEEEVLDEIRSLRRLAHQHVFSVYASYFVDDSIYILFSGVYERHLMSFLTDVPQQFKKLPKPRRRQILVNWPHCLANALAWLHANGQGHGAIRPSNVLIDSDFNVFLGQFQALDTLLPLAKVNDVEAYQYGAPERWVLSATVQETAKPSGTVLPSGGRTQRKEKQHRNNSHVPLKLNLTKHFSRHDNNNDDSISTYIASPTSRPGSPASHKTAIRVGFPGSPSRSSFALSSSSSGSDGSSSRRHAISSSIQRQISCSYAPSIASSNSSSSSASTSSNRQRTAVIQTWQSHQTNPHAADIFSVAAVTLDIFTHLCKRKLSAFTHHRGAKNRTAGRGGGVADASFHLDRNAGQVVSWITLLDADAGKRKDPVFRAVRDMLVVVRGMLERDPVKRPSAGDVERRFARAIIRGVGEQEEQVHCVRVPILTERRRMRERGNLVRGGTMTMSTSTIIDIPDPESESAPPSVREAEPEPKHEEEKGKTPLTPNAADFNFGFNDKWKDDTYSDDTTDDGFDDGLDEFDEFDEDDGDNHDVISTPDASWRDPDLVPDRAGPACPSASASRHEHDHATMESVKDPVLYYGIAIADK